MSAFKPFVLGSLMGAAMAYVSLQYHVVRSDEGFYVVSRAPQASLGLAYADIRNLSTEDLESNPELARAMAAHSARELLAKNDPDESDNSTSILDGSNMIDGARERLRSSNDFGDIEAPTIPKPPGSLDAPIWNPFNDKSSGSTFDSAEEDDFDSIPWPEDEPDPVAAQFDDGDSPFADITDVLEAATAEDADLGNSVENVASELDAVRDSFASRTRELADQFKQRNADVWSKKPGAKPSGFNQPRYSTNRVTAPEPGRSLTNSPPAQVPQPRTVPLRGNSHSLRNSLNRRAREIYEESRRRSSGSINNAIERAQSRADSVIDELVAPRGGSNIDALENATSSTPKRYTRGQN